MVAKILGYTPVAKSASLSWGIEHEVYARKRYTRQQKSLHKGFSCKDTGLRIHHEKFMLGASAYGLISCTCCDGFGVLEIKCPYSARDKNMRDYATSHNSCINAMSATTGVVYTLKPSHPYFTHIQHQMYVTGATYADFVYLPQE